MTHFKRILTLLFVMICLAASTSQADTYEPNGEPDRPGQGQILRPRFYGEGIPFIMNGRHIVFMIEEGKGPMDITCRNVRSGEIAYHTISSETPWVDLPSGGVWEIEAVYARQHYYGKVDVKEWAQL